MEFACMKIYFVKDSNGMPEYYVGINQIEIDPEVVKIDELMKFIEVIQSRHEDNVIQFFSDRYILNSEHILHACYFVQKAFFANNNISNKKNLELILYLATKRQIKQSLESFGINNYNLQNKRISYCIISSEDKFNHINTEINRQLHSNEISLNFGDLSINKYNRVKKYFQFSDNQILTVWRSYGYKIDILDLNSLELENLYKALNDLICEKMALLSLEKRNSC